MSITQDYLERVYAGVLGKIIGVYLGRPFEGWRYEDIMNRLGEIRGYVTSRHGEPLVVTDDDIIGTLTFLRALADYDYDPHLTPQQVAQTWLNYLIEGRTILWWGGLGMSTEHTAFLRLKAGIEAPASGSIATNGRVVAEQIGAQIFIDGWGLVSPGDPERAVHFARSAASVSHDGEAIYGAQVIAALVAQAFVETDMHKLLNTAVGFIPKDSTIYRLIQDVREWHAQQPADWRYGRERIAQHYGYDKFVGNCHIVPNHALIMLALLYGNDDFARSLLIVNTSGWDTDCNSGNVGSILGVKNGLAGIERGPDWRGPVADRIYLPTAEGGSAINDAVTQAYQIANVGRKLAGEAPLSAKGGARFHFELPGAVQGFQPDDATDAEGTTQLENVEGHSAEGTRSLALHYRNVQPGSVARAATATFIPREAINMGNYSLIASPTLYSGQVLRARIEADAWNRQPALCRLFIRTYAAQDAFALYYGPEIALAAGSEHTWTWQIPDTKGEPIAQVGLELSSQELSGGAIYLDYLTWYGEPDVLFAKPESRGNMWGRAWVNGVDIFEYWGGSPYRLSQNQGTGLVMQGTRKWRDYQVETTITPQAVQAAGVAVRVQGMKRYYALLLSSDGYVRLVKALDGEQILAEQSFPVEMFRSYAVTLQAKGPQIQGWLDGQLVCNVEDRDRPLETGAVGLVCKEGTMSAGPVRVQPAE